MVASTDLYDLIKSMDAEECAWFRQHAQRHKSQQAMTVKLFDAIRAQTEYDEKALLKQFEDAKFVRQFPVAKHALTKLVLRSLELETLGKTPDAEARSLLVQSEMLFERGLIPFSRRLADKSIQMALRYDLFLVALESVRLRMRIEKRSMDQAGASKMESLWKQEAELIRWIDLEHQLRKQHDLLLATLQRKGQGGMAWDAAAYHHLIAELPPPAEIPFTLRLVYFYCQIYHHQIQGDLTAVSDIYAAMVAAWESEPHMKKWRQDRYVTARLSALSAVLRAKGDQGLGEALQSGWDWLPQEGPAAARAFAMSRNLEISYLLRQAKMPFRPELETEISQGMQRHEAQMEPAMRLTLTYNTAVYLLMHHQFQPSLKWVRQILNEKHVDIRLDIRDFANAIQLILLFEMNELSLLEYRLSAVKRMAKGTPDTGALVLLTASLLNTITQQLSKPDPDPVAIFEDALNRFRTRRGQIGEETLGYSVVESWLKSRVKGIGILEASGMEEGG